EVHRTPLGARRPRSRARRGAAGHPAAVAAAGDGGEPHRGAARRARHAPRRPAGPPGRRGEVPPRLHQPAADAGASGALEPDRARDGLRARFGAHRPHGCAGRVLHRRRQDLLRAADGNRGSERPQRDARGRAGEVHARAMDRRRFRGSRGHGRRGVRRPLRGFGRDGQHGLARGRTQRAV
ncbi:MAG: hypothetical protein AVDCRST_MAG68-2467, partial [uncultured Gemmatimonadetes bacterium]